MLFLLFEVMDKEPSLLNVWLSFLLTGAVGFQLCRKHPAFLGVALPIALFLSWAWLTELHDPFVGPAIVRILTLAVYANDSFLFRPNESA